MNRVMVTGLGVVTPIGNNVAQYQQALFAGTSGFAPITYFDTAGFSSTFAAEVKHFNPVYRDTKIDFGLSAAYEAVEHATNNGRVALGEFYRNRSAAVVMGCGLELFSLPDLIAFRQTDACLPTAMEERVAFLSTPADVMPKLLSHKMRLTHAPELHISACAASTDAIGSAYRSIQNGSLDMAIAGGADSMINPMGFGSFCRLGALSERNDSPKTASRPFDKTRDGFVMGEGAGFMVLESLDLCIKRGATPIAEISGFGSSLDAYNVSDPHPEAYGATLSMQMALMDAGLTPNDISSINVHGTSTAKNDVIEALAIKKVMQDYARTVPIFATKSMVGHLISAAGAVECVACVLCLQLQRLHATINLNEPDPECDLNHVKESLNTPLKHILKNSFGFGGQNASLIISAC